MAQKQQNSHHFKKKVSEILTLLDESQNLAEQIPNVPTVIHTSLMFLSKATIDLNFQVHDFADREETPET